MPNKDIIEILEMIMSRLKEVQNTKDLEARNHQNFFIQGMLKVVINLLKRKR